MPARSSYPLSRARTAPGTGQREIGLEYKRRAPARPGTRNTVPEPAGPFLADRDRASPVASYSPCPTRTGCRKTDPLAPDPPVVDRATLRLLDQYRLVMLIARV